MRRISALLIVLAAALSGCADGKHKVLLPVEGSTEGTKRVDLLVATTRMRSADPSEMFSGERGHTMSFADIGVSIPPDSAREIGQVQWPKGSAANPATEFATVHANIVEKPEAASLFRAAVMRQPSRRVLVFIHGYNTQFADAVYGFAQFVHDSGTPAVPVLFTWPSRAKLLAYGYDRESANFSRDALEGVLRALAANPDVKEVSVLAHSMGNWLTVEALRQMSIRKEGIPAKIRDVVLAAPDIDVDVFRRQIKVIGARRPNMTIFVSQDDKALEASRRVWQSSAQLGAIDPEKEPLKSDLAKLGLTVINLTDVKATDSLAHGKFASSPEVVRFIGNRLASGTTIGSGGEGSSAESVGMLLTSVTSKAGQVAGAVITAPLAIVDPKSRESLGDAIGQVVGKDPAE